VGFIITTLHFMMRMNDIVDFVRCCKVWKVRGAEAEVVKSFPYSEQAFQDSLTEMALSLMATASGLDCKGFSGLSSLCLQLIPNKPPLLRRTSSRV
jgi:hypothetical protein